MPAGLTLAERNELRERYKQAAIEQAARMGLTQRCRYAADFGGDEAAQHSMCRGESWNGGGCLCTCHDASAGAAVISRKDEPRK